MEKKTRCFHSWILVSLIFIAQIHVASASDVDIVIRTDMAADEFKNFSEEIGLAISYLPLSPAEPLGILGWDVGIELTVIDINRDVWKNAVSSPPGTVILPKLHLQKGFPFAIDVGFIYAEVPSSNIKVIGGELKWAMISGNVALPAIAVRGSYTTLSGVNSLNIETIGADVSISKGFAFVTPYAGYGQVWINSEETATPSKFKEKISSTKPFIGVKISLVLINFVFEADFGKVTLYTGRFNLGF